MLTKRQQQILEFLRERKRQSGGVPTLREIMAHFGFSSPATVSSHLDLMERKGAIRREPGRSRNIILNEEPEEISGEAFDAPALLRIPVYGCIPAGLPSDQEQNPDRCIAIDAESIRLPVNARTFALQVRGDSMTGAGILDGDHVILEFAEPRHRDIVAALIDGETTLKRYLFRSGKPYLKAENPEYPDLIPARELVIQGVFRALVRIQP